MTEEEEKIRNKNNEMYLSLEAALEFVGSNSRYQRKVLTLMSVHWLLFCLFIKGFPFLYQSPLFLCSAEGQEFICDEYLACQNNQFTIFHNPQSIISSFQLYCLVNSRKVVVTIMNIFLGGFIGLFMFSSISTRKGRKKALLLSSIVSGVSLILASFQTQIEYVQVCFLLFGVGHGGYEKIMHLYLGEVSGKTFKKYSRQSFFIVFAVSQMLYNALDYLLKDWRLILFCIAVPLLCMNLFISRFVFESPVYLVSKARFQEAKNVLNQIALLNQRQAFGFRLEEELESRQLIKKYSQQIHKTDSVELEMEYGKYNLSYWDLVKFRSLRGTTWSLSLLWFSLDIVWIGVVYSIQSLGNDMNQTFLLLGVSELVAVLLNESVEGLVKQTLGYRKGLAYLFLMSAVGGGLVHWLDIPYLCLEATASCYQKTGNVLAVMTIKFCFTLALNLLHLYTEAIYPRVIQAKARNYNFFVRKFGCLFMPIIVEYSQQYNINPIEIFALLSFFSSFISITSLHYLPSKHNFIEETKQTEIPILEF